MHSTLETERAWLNAMKHAMLMGFAMIDREGRVVQQFSHDPALRDLLLNYQKEKIRQLELDERSLSSDKPKAPVTYQIPPWGS